MATTEVFEQQNHKLEALVGTMINELGAVANAAFVLIGDKLDLYRVLAKEGPLTSSELAQRGTFSMSPEQAAVLADDDSLVCMIGGFSSLAAVFASEPRLAEAFRTGEGIGWGEHCSCLFCGAERFFRPAYRANLLTSWLPSLDGVVEKLKKGARVADVGCGHGASTFIMAEAFPNSHFTGIDYHEPSIAHARQHAGKFANVQFEVARAQDFPGQYDLVTSDIPRTDACLSCVYSKGARGKYYRRLIEEGSNVVLLDPDVAKAFGTSAAVNEALWNLLKLSDDTQRLTARRVTRRRTKTLKGKRQ